MICTSYGPCCHVPCSSERPMYPRNHKKTCPCVFKRKHMFSVTVLYLHINISSELLVNIINIEHCLGGTTFKYVIMAALLFEDRLPSHVSAIGLNKMFTFLYVFFQGLVLKMNNHITVLLCWLFVPFILCDHVGLYSHVTKDWTLNDCTVTPFSWFIDNESTETSIFVKRSWAPDEYL